MQKSLAVGVSPISSKNGKTPTPSEERKPSLSKPTTWRKLRKALPNGPNRYELKNTLWGVVLLDNIDGCIYRVSDRSDTRRATDARFAVRFAQSRHHSGRRELIDRNAEDNEVLAFWCETPALSHVA